MISSQFTQEQQRLLISKIVLYEGKLNIVFDREPLIFSEITKVFSIPESRDTNESLYKLKERLVNICLQEKEEFLEYLCLPKFRQVSQHALELLKTALQEISQRIKIEQENAKFDALVNGIQKYMPKMSTLGEIENYHLRIFQLYSKSDICPVGAMQRQLEMMNAQKNQLKEMNSQWNFQNSPYSNFVKSVPQEMDQGKYDYWASQVNESKMAMQESQRMYPSGFYRGIQKPISSQMLMHPVLSNSSSLPLNHSSTSLKYLNRRQSKVSSSHMIEEYSQTSSIKRQKQEENSRMVEEYSQPLSNISQRKHKTFNVVDPNFKNCVCKGRIQKVGQEEFICEFCNGKYHSECLRINGSTDAQPKKKCPICTVQQLQNQCFELIRPSLLSSWSVYNKQYTTPSAIRFTQNILNQMKKIITKPQNKIYLKLITIKKKSTVHFDESLNNNMGNKMEEMKTKSNKEIGGDEGEGGIEYEMDENIKEDSEMMDQANELNDSQKKVVKQQANTFDKISTITQTKSSIQFTSQYISEMLKSSAPVLSLNFGYSPEYQDMNSKQTIEEQWLIYYGIYEVKRKQLPQILYKLTCESNVVAKQGEITVDVRNIGRLVGGQVIMNENKSLMVQKNQNHDKQTQPSSNSKSTVLNILISKKQLRQVAESSQNQTKQIYPVRFTSCNNIKHVFELQNYLESIYNYNLNSKTKQHYNLKRLSPDIDLNHCPLCVGNLLKISKEINSSDKSRDSLKIQQQRPHPYLDRKLHSLLNNPDILQEIILRYDNASSGQQYNYVDVAVEIKSFINHETKQIQYSYVLAQIEQNKEDVQEQGDINENQGNKVKQNRNKDESESMEAEDYMKDEVENQGNNIEHKQQEQEESVIDYGAD